MKQVTRPTKAPIQFERPPTSVPTAPGRFPERELRHQERNGPCEQEDHPGNQKRAAPVFGDHPQETPDVPGADGHPDSTE